jgi:HD-GYP domain-containing protein (c-di-GMP phosphodiesterase class II)
MRITGITELESGDVLARPVHGKNGMVMLEVGTVLTDQYINRLKDLKVKAVHLQESSSGSFAGIAVGGVHSLTSTDQMWFHPNINRLKNDDKAREEAVKLVTDFAETGLLQDRLVLPIPEEEFRRKFRDILMEIASQRVFAEELGVMMLTDRFLFEQALNVTLCSSIIGTAKDFDSTRMFDLSVGALFCDIGMTRLPTNLLKMNRALSESEIKIMRQHTTEGYHILKNKKEVSPQSAQVALLHHERYRGAGYPLAVRNESIPELAQIVGLADVYNALISPRHHRKPYSPGEATEYLFASGNYDFDLSLVQVFLKYLTIYPVSSVVRLSSGQVAMVKETAGRPIHRPVVEVFCEANGSVVRAPYLLDLQQLANVVIVGKADK